jgi:hypothetical protein
VTQFDPDDKAETDKQRLTAARADHYEQELQLDVAKVLGENEIVQTKQGELTRIRARIKVLEERVAPGK